MFELLCSPRYGIGLDAQPTTEEEEIEFLRRHRIYRTAAVKCHIDGQDGGGTPVIRRCRDIFLARQIAAMPNLRVIVPMGSVAITSLMGIRAGTPVYNVVGRGAGIRCPDPATGRDIIALPHPSPVNSHFRPPQPIAGDPQFGELAVDRGARPDTNVNDSLPRALRALRASLERAGYSLRVPAI